MGNGFHSLLLFSKSFTCLWLGTELRKPHACTLNLNPLKSSIKFAEICFIDISIAASCVLNNCCFSFHVTPQCFCPDPQAPLPFLGFIWREGAYRLSTLPYLTLQAVSSGSNSKAAFQTLVKFRALQGQPPRGGHLRPQMGVFLRCELSVVAGTGNNQAQYPEVALADST